MVGSMRHRRVTQSDVARLAGVSQAMVSYVLNDSTNVTVPDDTRQRIIAAMVELGYVPNRAARSLRTSKTFTIGCVIPDIANPFYPAFVRGIQDVVDHNEYDLAMYNTDGQLDREKKALRSLLQGRVDGVIGVFFHSGVRELSGLLDQQIALVRLEATAKPAGELPIDNIYVDNTAASRQAVSYLVARGYQRIAMLADQSGPGAPRVVGYRAALAACGRSTPEDYVQIGAFTVDGGAESMLRLLGLAQPPDAIFAANDLMAIGAIMACKLHGLQVPGDVAVMGFDDIAMGRLISPPLTTVTQFQNQLGQRAATMLFERINSDVQSQGRCVEMPFQIVVREST